MADFRPYGTDKKLDKLVDSEDWRDRCGAAKQGYGLDKLVDDKDLVVRIEVARWGYGLDKLIDDKDEDIRRVVAEQGYGLDKLVDDTHPDVRWAVARRGYGLDKLINDKNKYVRAAVAGQGYGLDKLLNDKEAIVRKEVARQGYGLDKLADDESYEVRYEVTEQRKKKITKDSRPHGTDMALFSSVSEFMIDNCGIGDMLDKVLYVMSEEYPEDAYRIWKETIGEDENILQNLFVDFKNDYDIILTTWEYIGKLCSFLENEGSVSVEYKERFNFLKDIADFKENSVFKKLANSIRENLMDYLDGNEYFRLSHISGYLNDRQNHITTINGFIFNCYISNGDMMPLEYMDLKELAKVKKLIKEELLTDDRYSSCQNDYRHILEEINKHFPELEEDVER